MPSSLPHVFTWMLLVCVACAGASPSAPLGVAGAASTGGNANPSGGEAGAGAASGAPIAGGSSPSAGNGGTTPTTGANHGGSAHAGGNGAAGTGGAGGAGGSGGGSAGQSTASVAFDRARVTVTGVRGTEAPAASAVIQLHNAGSSAAQLKGLTLSGSNQALFRLDNAPALPASLAAGAELSVQIALTTTGSSLPAAPANKDTGCVLLTATLSAALDSGTVSASVYGLVLTQDNYEPTLGQILTTLGYSLNVGKAQDNWNSNQSMNATGLPGVEAGTDEVAAEHFVKADSTASVGLALVARFSPVGALPYGWYTTTTGCPAGCTTVGTMAMISDAQTSDKARMVEPPPGAGSMSRFDPGSAPFGLWVYSDQKTQQYNEGGTVANGDWDYSEDALNAPASVHRFKSYPLKDAAGKSVAHTYLVAVEEAGNGDYQDYVFVLDNVNAVP